MFFLLNGMYMKVFVGITSFYLFYFVEERAPGTYEKARLRFAHAETLVPLSCLLGLFHEGSGEAFKVIS